MTHTAKVLLNCDIEYKNKIIFENKQVYFYADVDLCNIEWQGFHIDYFEVEGWHSDDTIKEGEQVGYLYTVSLSEWSSDDEVEEFDLYAEFTDFTLLVKSEDYDDIEIDYGQFEPDYDLMREGK